MKKLYILPLLLISFGSLFFVNPVFAQSEDEKILEFKSSITINTDATTDIVEEITFQPSTISPRHGLEWQIPYIYSVNFFRRNTELTFNDIYYYPLGNPELKTYNLFSRADENGWAVLRIGDPNVYIDGTYVYVIDYTLKYTGISYFEENDEVYLNIIGPGWSIPIENASANITAPSKILETVCYKGAEDANTQDCNIEDISESNLLISPKTRLEPYEGYSFAIKLEKGVIEDTTKEQIWLGILSNIGILLPIPVGIYLFGFLRKKFKNEKITVIPYYEPEKDMDSLLSGVLAENRFVPKHITALIIELAIGGYIKIREYEKKKYEFVKLEKETSSLSPHSSKLLEKIFKSGDVVKIKSLTDFYTTSNVVYTEASQSLKEKGLLSKKNINSKTLFIVLGIIAVAGTIFGGAFFAMMAMIGWAIGIFISGLLLFIFAFMIDVRTHEGNKKYHYLLGLKMYINTAEKHRIEFHNDPKRYNEIFEKLLPYAMIFGLEKKWAKEFEDIYTQNPDWYEGNFNTFNAWYLANSLSSLNNTVVHSATPPSNYSSGGGYRSGGWSSGGSGFGGGSVGGGGGGSGGGGW